MEDLNTTLSRTSSDLNFSETTFDENPGAATGDSPISDVTSVSDITTSEVCLASFSDTLSFNERSMESRRR